MLHDQTGSGNPICRPLNQKYTHISACTDGINNILTAIFCSMLHVQLSSGTIKHVVRPTGSGKSRMAAAKLEVSVSQFRQDGNIILTAIAMFSSTSYLMGRNVMFPHGMGNIQDGDLQTGNIHISAYRK